MKTCSRCGEAKSIDNFSKNKLTRDGLESRCRSCKAELYQARKNGLSEWYKQRTNARHQDNKWCCACNNILPLSSFGTRSSLKDGKRGTCLLCEREKDRNRYALNRETQQHRAKEYRKQNRDKHIAALKAWREKNHAKVIHDMRMRELAKRKRTPAWLTEKDKLLIERKYSLAQKKTENTRERWVVDHILPLRGEFVSGLHVPSNLRVIKATTNARKYNKYVPV